MQATNRGAVKFKVRDPVDVSKALAELGIDHHYVNPSTYGEVATMTAFYQGAEEAGALLIYLIESTASEDKIAWYQTGAHDEIEGWCKLCETANSGCSGSCLMNHRSDKHLDFLFLRPANKSASSS